MHALRLAEPNVLLIVCDTLRTDHMGCYGYFRDTTPIIDEMSKEGVLFEDFYVAGCPTGPAFTSIITGLHPIHHGFYLFDCPNIRLVDDGIFTLAEIMRVCGYTTAAVDNLMNFPSHPKHFVRGYEYYINLTPSPFFLPPRVTADQINRRLIPWLKDHSKEKFFLFVHYWDPHTNIGGYLIPEEKYKRKFRHEKGKISDLEVREAPAGYWYVPGWGKIDEIYEGDEDSDGYFSRKWPSIDKYDGEIAYMDNAIGEIFSVLKEKDIFDDTIILVTSDHGEQLGQHGIYGHVGLHDAVIRVPLIIRYPKGIPKGRRVKGFAQHTDLLPTILGLADIPAKLPEMDGQNLLPLIKGEKVRDRIFIESGGLERAIRTEEWKFIERFGRYKNFQLYNLKDDPMEVVNLVEKREREALSLRDSLHSWVKANLKEGEEDPMLTYRREEIHKKRMEFHKKLREMLSSFLPEESIKEHFPKEYYLTF